MIRHRRVTWLLLIWLHFYAAGANRDIGDKGDKSCPPATYLPHLGGRSQLGALARSLGLQGASAELGVQQGVFSDMLHRGWKKSNHFTQVDVWKSLSNYADVANVEQSVQDKYQADAKWVLESLKHDGHIKKFEQCKGFTTDCVSKFEDESLDLIYVDARHDRLGVIVDIGAYWAKLRPGGIMAGHDYMEQSDPTAWCRGAVHDPANSLQDWTLNFDGSRDETNRTVKGAVDDFFSGALGTASRTNRAPSSPPSLVHCPIQVQVTIHEQCWNTWMVAKPRQSKRKTCPPLKFVEPMHTRFQLQERAPQWGGGTDQVVELWIPARSTAGLKAMMNEPRRALAATWARAWKSTSYFAHSAAAAATLDLDIGPATTAPAIRQVALSNLPTGANFVYMHQPPSLAVAETLRAAWASLARGGVLAGPGYTKAKEPGHLRAGERHKSERKAPGQSSRVAGGSMEYATAIDAFFSGLDCPVQISVVYREGDSRLGDKVSDGAVWVVRKP